MTAFYDGRLSDEHREQISRGKEVTTMCHLILLLPLIALPLFWLLPLALSLPLYLGISALSALIYYLAIKAMRRPVETGVEALMHSTGEVVGKEGKQFRVRALNELWYAESTDNLQMGDRINIVEMKGLTLVVRRSMDSGAEQGTKKGEPTTETTRE